MWRSVALGLVLAVVGLVAACEGPAGPPGEPGPAGSDGSAPETYGIAGVGLRVNVESATVGPDRSLTVGLRITDATSNPLDRDGLRTEGEITIRFVVAALEADGAGGPGQYTAYTASTNMAASGETAVQADADEGGTFTAGDAPGRYSYRFGTLLPEGFDPSTTHTIGIWAWRNVGTKRYVANTIHHFVPSGAPVTLTREIVKTQACNGCHNPMAHHEGDVARRETALCILCHAGSMRDPDSGNSLDFRVIIHKMHRGKLLPSVVAGKPYELFTEDHEADDFSTVVFPQEIQNCPKCHAGAQGDRWKTRPSRTACGSCHDLTSFVEPLPAGMKLHSGGAQADDTKCNVCHEPAGGLAGIADVHRTPTLDPSSPVLALTITSVDTMGPGQTPVVHFGVTKSGAALDILATPLARLAVTVAGPTMDYAQSSPTTYTVQGSGATGVLATEPGGYRYTLPMALPSNASGTWAVGMEGYIQPDPSKAELRFAALNPVVYVPVTDAAPVPRRAVVSRERCNSCHYALSAHGGTRRSVEYCVLCHTPNKVNDQRVSRFQVAETTARSVDMKVLIHKIHMGEELTEPYVAGGFPAPTPQNPAGTPVDFGKTRYPGDRRACWTCHEGTSYTLPLAAGLLSTKMSQVLACTDTPLDPTKYCNARQVASETFAGPTAAACTACHDAPATIAHAQLMTTPSGAESCATCHGPDKTWDVQIVHAPSP